jgi:Ca-activated chloride channel family protein
MLVDNLRDKDRVAIVTYGGGVEVELPSTSGSNKKAIKNVIDSLDASGDTPGAGAIKTAYSVAKEAFIKGGNNRVILATDGDFNVGQTTDKELEDIITIQRNSGIYLTCIGVGMGNYKDSKLETLAKKGNGNFAYLDNIQEAEKVLVKEFTKTVYAVAKDAFINIQFNSNAVKQYRLIGFDNKKDAATDLTSTMAGGEVGSGHGAMAVFEIEPTRNVLSPYECLAEVNLQYKKINSDSAIQVQVPVYNQSPIKIDSADLNLRLATAICMYGSLLKKSKHTKGYDLEDIYNFVAPVLRKDNYLHQEFLGLLHKTEDIYHVNKNKKKKKKK